MAFLLNLGKLSSSTAISNNLEVQIYIYDVDMPSGILYDSETWPLGRTEEIRLEIFE